MTIISRIQRTVSRKTSKLIIVLIFLITSCVLANKYFPEVLNSTLLILDQYAFLFVFIRWLAIILLVVFWPILVNGVCHHYKIPQEQIVYWQKERFRIATWLILFELLVCEHVVIKLSNLI